MKRYKDFKLNRPGRYAATIYEFLEPNPDYESSLSELKEMYDDGDRIYELVFPHNPLTLVVDDRGCVRVDYLGRCVGYIKDVDCDEVKALMESPEYSKSFLHVEMGSYIELYEDDDTGRLKKRLGDDEGIEATVTMVFEDKPAEPIKTEAVKQPRAKRQTAPKSKGLFIFMRILSAIIAVLGLVICIVNPIVGIICIALGVVFFITAKKYKPQ